ncbi:hypothetical protein [Streptomyces sp. NPDC048251]
MWAHRGLSGSIIQKWGLLNMAAATAGVQSCVWASSVISSVVMGRSTT